MTTGKKQRIAWIDIAKGISIALVVFMHVVMAAHDDKFPVWRLFRLNELLSPIRMPLFFTVAGVFAGKTIAGSWTTLLTKKVALYTWLILIWSAVLIILYNVINLNLNMSAENLAGKLFWSLLVPKSVLWFLWALAVFFVLTKILSKFDLRIGIVLSIIASLAGLYAQLSQAVAWNPIGANLAYRGSLIYFSFFFAGTMFPNVIKSLGNSRVIWLPVLAAVAIAAIVGTVLADGVMIRGVLQFVASAFSVAALLIASRIIGGLPFISSSLTYLGRNTLPVYVAHMPFVWAVLPLMRALGIDKSQYLSAMAMFAETLLVVLLTLGLRQVLTIAGCGWAYRLPRRVRTKRRSVTTKEPSRPAVEPAAT